MAIRMMVGVCAVLALVGCQQAKPTVQLMNGGSESLVRKGVTLAAGTSARLDFLASINPDCTQTGANPTVRVLQQPKHGAVEVTTVQDYPNFPHGNPRFHCDKVRVSGTLITYRPQADFLGSDDFSYEVFTSTGSMSHMDITATVM